jgi:hypothetical protein
MIISETRAQAVIGSGCVSYRVVSDFESVDLLLCCLIARARARSCGRGII